MSSLYSFQAKLGLPFQVLNSCSPSVVRAKKLVFLFSKATKDTPGLLAINASLSVLCLNSKKYSAMPYYIVGRFDLFLFVDAKIRIILKKQTICSKKVKKFARCGSHLRKIGILYLTKIDELWQLHQFGKIILSPWAQRR